METIITFIILAIIITKGYKLSLAQAGVVVLAWAGFVDFNSMGNGDIVLYIGKDTEYYLLTIWTAAILYYNKDKAIGLWLSFILLIVYFNFRMEQVFYNLFPKGDFPYEATSGIGDRVSYEVIKGSPWMLKYKKYLVLPPNSWVMETRYFINK